MIRLVPVTLRCAREFTNRNHRHNIGAKGHKFSIGLEEDGNLIGIVTVGRPIARSLDDGFTCEITRCCVIENAINANSRLYGAACRAAKAMGFTRAVTYTLQSESGSSLLASGFENVGTVKLHDWNTPSRPRKTLEADKYPCCDKYRWEKQL